MKCVYKKIVCEDYAGQNYYVREEMLENPESTGSKFDFTDSDERMFILQDIFRVFGVPADVQGPSDVLYSRIEQCYYDSSTFVEGKLYNIELEWRQNGVIVYAWFNHRAEYTINYHVHDFLDEEICYLVEENFPVPYDGVPTGRMYHDVFTEEAEALKYYDSMTLREGFGNSVKLLLVVEKAVIGHSFYEWNRQAMRLMEETGETPDSDSFRVDVNEHIKALEKIKLGKMNK